ncbi:MAG: hypothetical protein Q9192_002743 [Flavoplaca navasiana]
MPRIKAITTGSTPSFLDVILNFAEGDKSSSLENQDTWLGQLKAMRDGRLILYGDDTWLKLFPSTFAHADGTSSFFVSLHKLRVENQDFTEVDFNVTRNVPAALDQHDWTGMVLHYLGLDHIGHKSGPTSPHMIPKQAEMDTVVKMIYQGLESEGHLQSTLLVLCGDHGMNEAGNHGGSAEGETSPALVFISPKLRSISQGRECPTTALNDGHGFYTKIHQSDIAPTLAGLLGIPIPRNNLGVFIPDLLRFWPHEDRVRLLEQNAKQVHDVFQQTFSTVSFQDGTQSETCADVSTDDAQLACLWYNMKKLSDIQGQQHDDQIQQAALHTVRAVVLIERRADSLQFLTEAQMLMSNTASNYSIVKLYAGTAIAALVALWNSCRSFPLLMQKPTFGAWFLLVTIVYGVSMFASSFVEEEHQYWYMIASGWLGWLGMKQWVQTFAIGATTVNEDSGRDRSKGWSAAAAMIPFLIMRILRCWNQTGQKHASQPDIARGIFPAHNYMLWSLVLTSYLVVLVKMSLPARSRKGRFVSLVAAFSLSAMALAFKISFTMADSPELLRGIGILRALASSGIGLVIQARTVFLGMFTYAVGIILSNRRKRLNPEVEGKVTTPIVVWLKNDGSTQHGRAETLRGVLTLFLMTQSRVTNIPLFVLFEIQMQVLASTDLSTREISLTSIILQYSSFFAFGGSNAISSVDLSNAYNGVSSYNVAAVGILAFCSNWAGPIWWLTATLLLAGRQQQDRCECLGQLQLLSTSFVANANMSVMLACTSLRTHLFIWTVFSPKYLFTMAWSLGQHLCISVAAFELYMWWLWS